jgi:hypothetical protein
VASIDILIAHLRDALGHLRQAIPGARRSEDMAAELRERFNALGVHDLVARMEAVREHAEVLTARLDVGIETGERLVEQAEAVRGSGDRPGPAVAAVTGGQSAPGMPALAGRDGLATVLAMLPRRAGDDSPTSGHVFGEDGRPVRRGALRSFRDPGLLADLDLTPKGRRSESMLSHVEAKVAALMRRGEIPQRAVLVINNEDGPCGWLRGRQGKVRYGTSCDELLADVLPLDSTLTVRWRDAGGLEHSQVYRGTGRRIRA